MASVEQALPDAGRTHEESGLRGISGGTSFHLLWLFIGLVSAFDAYLVLKYQDLIYYLECNPVGRFLMEIDPARPALFVGAKFLGTIVVLYLLQGIYNSNQRVGRLLAGSIAAFQFLLLGWLVLT